MEISEELLADFQSLSDEQQEDVIALIKFFKNRNRELIERLIDETIEENYEALKKLAE